MQYAVRLTSQHHHLYTIKAITGKILLGLTSVYNTEITASKQGSKCCEKAVGSHGPHTSTRSVNSHAYYHILWPAQPSENWNSRSLLTIKSGKIEVVFPFQHYCTSAVLITWGATANFVAIENLLLRMYCLTEVRYTEAVHKTTVLTTYIITFTYELQR